MNATKKRALPWALMLFIAAPFSAAHGQSGWDRLGKAVGKGSEDAYEQGYLEGIERETQRLNREAAETEAQLRSYVEQVKAALSATWQKAGFSADDAEALAAAYELTGTERAVVAGVRRKGTQQASLDIRAALDANNYLLANQLLLGVLVVSREEREAAPQSEGTRTAP